MVINSAARPYESSRERDNESERGVERGQERVESEETTRGEGEIEGRRRLNEGDKERELIENNVWRAALFLCVCVGR